MAVDPVVPVGSLMPPPCARHAPHCVRVAPVRPPPLRAPSIVLPVAVPVPDRADRMLYERAIAEIGRLRQALGSSDMALQAARSEAARATIAASARCDAFDASSAGASEGAGRPVPGTMKPRPRGDLGGVGGAASGAAPGADGAAPLVRSVVLRSPRSLVDFFA